MNVCSSTASTPDSRKRVHLGSRTNQQALSALSHSGNCHYVQPKRVILFYPHEFYKYLKFSCLHQKKVVQMLFMDLAHLAPSVIFYYNRQIVLLQ